MAVGVHGDFKERHEDVVEHLLEVGEQALVLVHVVQPGGVRGWVGWEE